MTPIERLNQIQPGERIVYWEDGVIIPDLTRAEIFKAVNQAYVDDRVYPMQEVIGVGEPIQGRTTTNSRYFVIGKVAAPCPKDVNRRRDYVDSLDYKWRKGGFV